MSLEKEFKNIKKKVSLSDFNTFNIGGDADFLIEVKNKDELKKAIYYANLNKTKYYVLGSGTNVLVSDFGFSGLVILNKMDDLSFNLESDFIIASSGLSMGVLTQRAKAKGLSGLEWACGLPGTLGGAIYGNAGCCGGDISESVVSVEVFDPVMLEFKHVKKEDCNFSYRHSIFKDKNYIIVGATLKLKKDDPVKIMNLMAENVLFRRNHQPLSEKTEGCVFKNIYLNLRKDLNIEKLKENPELDVFLKKGVIPAGFLIDKAGLKDFSVGGARVSKRHANFLIRKDNAKAKDIYELIKKIKKIVYDKFEIELEEELQFLSF